MDQPEPTEVVVIGMGPGGEYAVGPLAEAGPHVTAIESGLVGGECPYYGCRSIDDALANLGAS